MASRWRALGLVPGLMVGCAGTDDAGGDLAPTAPEVAVTPRNPRTDDDLVLVVLTPASDPDGGEVRLKVRWSIDGEAEPAWADALEVPASATTKDEWWRATVVAVDDEGLESEPVTADADIENTPPTVAVTLEPAAPTAADALTARVTSADADGDDVDAPLAWSLDGVADPTWDGQTTVPSSALARGQRWSVRVVGDDGDAESEPATAEVTIADSPPTVTAATLAPATVREADTITASATATDPEGDTVSFTWTWRVNGTPVPGVTGDTLGGTVFDEGDVVTAEVLAVASGGGRSVPFATNSVTVVNSAPTLTGAIVAPSSGDERTVFACTPVGLADPDPADTPTTQVVWLVDGAEVATTPTLTGAAFARGDVVACRLTPADESTTGAPATSPGVTVGNAPPSLASVALGPAGTTVTGTFVATPGAATDPDGDAVALRYAWRVNGAPVAGTEATLAASGLARGDSVVVLVTPSDGLVDGPAVSSAAVVVANAPPTLADLVFAPERTDAFHDLSVTVDPADPDGDTVTLHYAWTVDGAPAGGDAAVLPQAAFTRGALVAVTVTGSDGQGGVSAPLTGEVEIGDAPPVPGTARVEPLDPLSSDDLTCHVDTPGSDPDGDTLEYWFAWYADGQLVVFDTTPDTATSSVLSADETWVGQRWTCAALACDATWCAEGPDSNVVEILPVSCVTNASDDGTGDCACNFGYRWCDATRASCCVAPIRFDVTIDRAEIAGVKPSGATWDAVLFTSPDAYVDVYVDGVYQGSTQTVDDTTTPVWGESFLSLVIGTRSTLRFEVYDEDTFGSEFIGSFSYGYESVLARADAGNQTVQGTSVRSFTFRVDTP